MHNGGSAKFRMGFMIAVFGFGSMTLAAQGVGLCDMTPRSNRSLGVTSDANENPSLETAFKMALRYELSLGDGTGGGDTMPRAAATPKRRSYQSGVEFLVAEACNLAALGIGYHLAGFGTSTVNTGPGVIGYVAAYTILAPTATWFLNSVVFRTKGSVIASGCGSCLGSGLAVALAGVPMQGMWAVCALVLPPALTLIGYHL